MEKTIEGAEASSRSAHLDDDQFVSSIAVIVCLALLLLVVVALAIFTRLGGV